MKILNFINSLLIKSIYAEEAGGTNISGANMVDTSVGFQIPTLTSILTFVVRFFFIIAGLIALIFLLLGAFAWITSSGNKESVQKAQDKIQAAVIGLILIVVVLAIAVTLETVVFNKKVCFGISCPLVIPSLLK